MRFHILAIKFYDFSLLCPIREMNNTFRENLRAELDYQGVTVKELSARTGIPVATLDCYLGARATIPSVDTAIKIARALQVTVEYLVISEKEGAVSPSKKPSQEMRELIRKIENLDSEQCKAILNMISIFTKQKAYVSQREK